MQFSTLKSNKSKAFRHKPKVLGNLGYGQDNHKGSLKSVFFTLFWKNECQHIFP